MLILTELILKQIGETVCERLKYDIKNKRVTRYGAVNASGQLYDSVRYDVTGGEMLSVYAEDYIYYLIYGRANGKRPPKDAILKWIDAKGITPDGITKDSLAFLIQRKIGEKGTTIFEQGGSDLLSDIISDDLVIEAQNQLANEILNSFTAELVGIEFKAV